MSSSPESVAGLRVRAGAPRVGVIRGVVTSPDRVLAQALPRAGSTAADHPSVAAARETAAQEGFAEGFRRGQAAGFADAQAAAAEHDRAVASALDALESAAASLTAREATGLEALADEATALGLAIARMVLDREVVTAADPGADAIARALALAPEEGDVTVRLHPDDVAALGDLPAAAAGRTVSVVADPSVTPGGCTASVGATRIDAQVAAALARVAAVLS